MTASVNNEPPSSTRELGRLWTRKVHTTAFRGATRARIWAVLALLSPACQGIPPRPADWLIDPAPFRARVVHEGNGLALENGLIRRGFLTSPGLACVELGFGSSGANLVRAIEPEARLVLDGREFAVGGLLGQTNRAFLSPAVELRADPAAFRLVRWGAGPIEARLAWKRARPSEGRAWPPTGVHLELEFAPPVEFVETQGIRVLVHHELYDGLPLVSKWLEVRNDGQRPRRLERFESERLAVVEPGSAVEHRERWPESPLLAFSDYSMGGQEQAVSWTTDPLYTTQVNYRLQTPCLLVSRPPLGPDQELAPGARFVSQRTFELLLDTNERERATLSLRRALRTLAPWATENPLILHATSAAPADVRRAIDQAAEVGFELVLLSLGSSFDLESTDPAYAESIRELVEYAHTRGVELGGYSLLASRRISD